MVLFCYAQFARCAMASQTKHGANAGAWAHATLVGLGVLGGMACCGHGANYLAFRQMHRAKCFATPLKKPPCKGAMCGGPCGCTACLWLEKALHKFIYQAQGGQVACTDHRVCSSCPKAVGPWVGMPQQSLPALC